MENEDMKLHAAIRCAKAAMVLHSLGNRREHQEKEKMHQKVEELKMELVKERYIRKNLKTCNLFEFSILIVSLFSLSTFLLLLALKFI